VRAILLALLLIVSGCGGFGPAAPQAPPSAVLARLKVGTAPTLLVASPDGRRVYAASNGSISFIDATTNTVLKTVNDAPNSTGIAVAPNGAKAYVTHLFSIDLTVIDTATDSLGTPVTMFLQRLRGGLGSWRWRPTIRPSTSPTRPTRRSASSTSPAARAAC
jgi:YVTN family beta-propeller protein